MGRGPCGLCGIDLSADRIAAARQRIPHADLRIGSAAELPWPDASFDLVSQFTVFTSILDPGLKRAMADEMLRVLKPDGSILWFDFRVNNPNNAQVRGVAAERNSSFVRRLRDPACVGVLAPPISRRVTGWSRPLAGVIESGAVFCARTMSALFIRAQSDVTQHQSSRKINSLSAPLRILHVTPTLTVGGAEQMATHLMVGLSRVTHCGRSGTVPGGE